MWKFFGQVLQWIGALYFVGFAIFGLFALLLLIPKFQGSFTAAGQAGVFGFGQEIIGPLVLFFLFLSGAAWFQGHELVLDEDVNFFDRIVAVVILVAVVVLATPQLYLAYSSLIPALKS